MIDFNAILIYYCTKKKLKASKLSVIDKPNSFWGHTKCVNGDKELCFCM